jgi:hypothetical protein
MVPQELFNIMNWQAIGVILAGLSLVAALATAFLHLTIKSTMNDATSKMMEKIEAKFTPKTELDLQLKLINSQQVTANAEMSHLNTRVLQTSTDIAELRKALMDAINKIDSVRVGTGRSNNNT